MSNNPLVTKTLFVLSLVLIHLLGFSQDKSVTRIYGMVVDTNDAGMPFATIQFLKTNDSSLVCGTISDENGYFIIDSVTLNTYKIKVSCVGYKPLYREQKITEKKKETYLKRFRLTTDPVQLDCVEITGKATGIRELADKTVYYPDSLKIESSRNGLEIIDKLPEIKVDKKDEEIKVLGNSNVLVLINGVNNNRTLKSINPLDIERIEVITHPSAKYRSDISSVVNVVLKDNRQQGLSLYSDISVCLHQNNHFGIFQLGYVSNKWQLSLNYTGMTYYSLSRDTSSMIEKSSGNLYEYSSYSSKNNIFTSNTHRIQYGIDFSPDKKNLFSFTGQTKWSGSFFENHQNLFGIANDSLNRMSRSAQSIESHNTQNNFSLFYKRRFKNENELSWNTNFYLLNDFSDIDIYDSSQYYNPEYSSETNRKERYDFFQFSINSKIDHTHNFSKKLRLETGYQLYSRHIESEKKSEIIQSNLDYYDLRNSVYTNLVFNSNSHGFQAGFRLERSDIKVYDSISNNYIKLLPSLSYFLKLNTKNSLRFIYNQKLEYPPYFLLNPYIAFSSDSLKLSSGNPFLLPEHRHIYNLIYILGAKKF